MPVITLTSDWIKSDYYVAAIKGSILKECPGATIIDINHQVQTFNISEAAFIIRHTFTHFPEGTIHLVAVNTEPSREKGLVAVKCDGHYFVGADNGIFGLSLPSECEMIVSLPDDEERQPTFPALGILASATAHLANGNPLENLGPKKEKLYYQAPIMATMDDTIINGSIIYIDSYQNAITNISKELFDQVGKGRRFEILVQSNHYKITRINKRYGETTAGELLALFNSSGLLEIAINMGNAAELLNIGKKSIVRIKFYD